MLRMCASVLSVCASVSSCLCIFCYNYKVAKQSHIKKKYIFISWRRLPKVRRIRICTLVVGPLLTTVTVTFWLEDVNVHTNKQVANWNELLDAN